MIACNGWLDVFLYASARADIVLTEYPPGEEVGLEIDPLSARKISTR